MKKIFKITNLFFIAIFIFNMFCFAFAANDNYDFSGFDNHTASANLVNAEQTFFGTGIAIARIIVVGIAVIMLMVVGMKYMMSSANDRAEIKKNAIAYVIGAFILFGSSAILGVINDVAKTVS